jgi:hypothetical protein
MKMKKELLVLGLVILALAAYLYQRSGDRTRYSLPAVPALAAADVTRIQVTRAGQSVVLVRSGELWRIDPQGFAADPGKLKEILEAISGFGLTALVSESKNFALYELDEEHKINVKAWQGEQLKRDFDIGKAAPSFRHTFVSLAGDGRVFHGRDNIRFRFEGGVADFRDKSVLAFDRAEITEIRITQAGATLTLTRAPEEKKEDAAGASPAAESRGVWKSADGRTAAGPVVASLLEALADLKCESFVEAREKTSFTQPVYALVLKGAKEHSLAVFEPETADGKDRPAVSSGSDWPFLLPESVAARIMPGLQELFKSE